MRQPDITAPPNSNVLGMQVLRQTDIWLLAPHEALPTGYGYYQEAGIRMAFRPHGKEGQDAKAGSGSLIN